MNNQGSSANSRATAQLSPEARRAITLGLCEGNTAQMLTDAGRASQQARYVGGEKPVRKPVNAHDYGAGKKNEGQGQGK
ncbi:MAG: hypothetical protein Q9188_005851 [Gyalolechia gomerana]|nr:MAG: hypothetical protein LQ343_000769 [Gyalolechia ehrenbergii]